MDSAKPSPATKSCEALHSHGGHSHGAGPPIDGAIAAALCAAFGMAGWLCSNWGGLFLSSFLSGGLSAALFTLAYAAGGIPPTIGALSALRRGDLNVDLLMIVAAAGAAAIGD